MMNSHQTVLAIGGTRGTGLLIVRLLHERGYRVRVLARNPERALTLFEKSVDVVGGDLTRPETLRRAIEGASHIVFTAGCRSGYPVREGKIKATEYHGVINTLNTARQLGFAGRFMYMTASGSTTPSLSTFCLNVWKGNT